MKSDNITTTPVDTIDTTTQTTTTNDKESEVTNMNDTITTTAPVTESTTADQTAAAVNAIVDTITAPIVKPTAYADFLRGLRSEGNRSSMTARVCDSVLGMAFGEYKLMMDDIVNASVFLTSKVTKGVHKDIVDAENALYTRLSKVFALAGLLVDRSDLYFCAFHCLQLKRTKAVVNEDGTTTAGTMFSTGKTLTGACKMVEVLIGMRLDGYVWNEEHEEFRAATEDQRKKFEKQVEKYNEKKNKPAPAKKVENKSTTANKGTTTKKSTANKGKKAA